MLESLHIENMAVIRSLDLCPGEGLTVLTGETGAGKSVIIESISFLLGCQVSRDTVRNGEEFSSVSGLFSVSDSDIISRLEQIGICLNEGQLLLERTQTREGKSVCRINGKAVTKQILTEAGNTLVSIHGQKDTRTIENSSSRLLIIDSLSDSQNVLEAYRNCFREWVAVKNKLAVIRRSEDEKKRLKDLLEYQIKDIRSASLRIGEEDEILSEKRKLQNTEKIRRQTGIALRAVYRNDKGITAPYLADRAADALEKIVSEFPELDSLCERLRECSAQLEDIAQEIVSIASDSGSLTQEQADREIDRLETRLETISKLKRKYGSSEADVLAYLDNAEKQLSEIDESERLIDELEKSENDFLKSLQYHADKLSECRKTAARKLEKTVLDTLVYLDMPGVSFAVCVEPLGQPGPDGFDSVDFYLSANPGEPLLPLSKCASGGELSRVMLALKCAIAGAYGIPTLIFDEIDTGISGSTSRKIGMKLVQASSSAQIICVTHSAQIASLADTHILIEKKQVMGRTETGARLLDREGRISENARILGGISVTDSQRRAAMDLIDNRKE